MTTIKLTSKCCPSYVTLECHPSNKKYEKILGLFHEKSSGGEDSGIAFECDDAEHHITQLSDKGIVLYFTQKELDGLPYYTIKAIVDPRKVLDSDTDYLGIMPHDEDSFRKFKSRFNSLMKSFQLPKLNKWKLTKVDMCVDLRYDSKKVAWEQLHSFDKTEWKGTMERVYYTDQSSGAKAQEHQREMDQHSYRVKNERFRLMAYDKQFQIEADEFISDEGNLSKCALRIKLRCKKPCLEKLKKSHSLNNTSQLLAFLGEYSRDILLRKVRHILPDDTHYKTDIACDLIHSSRFNDYMKDQMIWLYKQLRHPYSIDELVDKTKMRYGLTTHEIFKRIDQLENMGLL